MSDRITPLDPEEAELARALRSLPIVAPGARIDADILAAARTAVQRRSPVRRPWIWSLGTAAAAVLAFGTLLRMQHSGLEPLDEARIAPPSQEAEQVPQTTGRSEPEQQPAAAADEPDDAESARLDRIEVSGTRIKAEPIPIAEPAAEMSLPAPPPPAAPPAPSAPPAAVTPRPEAFPAPKSIVAPEPRPAAPSRVLPAIKREAPTPPAESPAPMPQSAQPAAPPPRPSDTPQPARRERGASLELQTSKSAGSAAALDTQSEIDTQATTDRGITEDTQAVFTRVRDLLAAGKRRQARDVLRTWRRAHPDHPLPDDLRILLE